MMFIHSRARVMAVAFGLSMILTACSKQPEHGELVQAPMAENDVQPLPEPAVAEVNVALNENFAELEAVKIASAARTGKSCSLDSVDGDYFQGGHDTTKVKPTSVRGWVTNDIKPVQGNVVLVLNSQKAWGLEIPLDQPRPDVADFYKEPKVGHAGFNVSVSFSAVPDGTYAVLFMFGPADGRRVCDSGKTLTIKS